MSMEKFDPKQRFRGRLSRNVLLILLPLSLLPVLFVGAVAYYRAYTLLQSQITNQLSTIVENQSELISSRAEAKKAFLDLLIEKPTFRSYLNRLLTMPVEDVSYEAAQEQALNEYQNVLLAEDEPVLDHLLIVLPDTTVMFSSNKDWQGIKFSNGAAYTELLNEDSSLILYNTTPLYRNRLLTFASKQYRDENGEIRATLVGISEPFSSQRVLEAVESIHPEAVSYYFTHDGFYIGLEEEGNALVAIPISSNNKDILASIFQGEAQEGHVDLQSIDNKPAFGFIKWIQATNTGLIVELPNHVISAPLTQLATQIAPVVGITLILMGIIISNGSSRLVKPLLSLADATRLFAEGDWRRRATVDRNDELGLLAYSFNHMADELSSAYRFMESKVEERTRQMRTAAEVAQAATSASGLQELLHRTVNLIIERFGYYDTSIFLLNETGESAVLTANAGASEARGITKELKFGVGSRSLIGWVTQHNQARMASDVTQDPFFQKDELLSETRSEAVVPISLGSRVLGALDVQSKDLEAFSSEDMAVLQTLANQLATAIHNTRLLEATQINLEEASLLYHASRQITQAESEEEIIQAAASALNRTSFTTAVLFRDNQGWRFLFSQRNEEQAGVDVYGAPLLLLSDNEVKTFLAPDSSSLIIDLTNDAQQIPPVLLDKIENWTCEAAAFIQVFSAGQVKAVLVLGSQYKTSLTPTSIQPFDNLAELTGTAIEKVQVRRSMEQRIAELQTLSVTSQVVAVGTELNELYKTLHKQITHLLGDVNFLIALFNDEAQQIEVPYMYDGVEIQSIPPFPLGEGVTSILIQKRQPILVVEDAENQLRQLGAKIVGAPAKSWLGVPLIVAGEPVGAMVVQDTEHERRFNQDDLRVISALSSQVAAIIHNAQLLDQTRKQAERERTLNDIVSKIRNSTDMQTIVATTARELAKVLDVRRAEIEIGVQVTAPEAPPENGHKLNDDSGVETGEPAQ